MIAATPSPAIPRPRSLFLFAVIGLAAVAAVPGVGAMAQSSPGAAATRFVRDPARFEANQAKLVAATRRRSPAMAEALERSFRQDILGAVSAELRRVGLDTSDVADMTAAYWVMAWEASNGIIGETTDPALVAGARRQIAGKMAKSTAALRDADKQDIADTMLLQALMIDARMKAVAGQGAAARRKMSDAIHAEAAQLLRTDLRGVKLTAAGFAPASGSVQTPAAPPATPPGERAAPHAGNWQRVEGVYFKSYTSFGVGGMMIQDFEPVILFRDGSYYEVEGPALEDVDLAASRAAHPRAWGRWKRQGATFLLTDDRGRTEDYQLQQGSFFKAYPAEAIGGKLARTYKRVSGGGNSALGGTMAIAAQTNLAFSPDGSFSTNSSAGAVGANVAASSRRRGGVGRYRIERHTISFLDPGGGTRREFFALGSEGAIPRVDSDMIFIGDRVFVKDD